MCYLIIQRFAFVFLRHGCRNLVLEILIVQVGSHYHFIEVNPFLVFDRRKAYGMRLNIPAGTATRFEVDSSLNFIISVHSVLFL